jgi:hypothetical protein
MKETTCYTIISRDVPLLEWCLTNARERAGIDHQWLVVLWVNDEREAQSVRGWCRTHSVRFVEHLATLEEDYTTRTDWFLYNLYACWNKGYEEAHTPWVARLGSDQFFSQDWLKNLHLAADKYGEDALYHCNTVESMVAQGSRHEVRDWGVTYATFKERPFDRYAQDLAQRYAAQKALPAKDCNLYFRHPARGIQLRPDGCTWLQKKSLWDQFGPLEDRVNQEWVTGDVDYMDRLDDAGVPGYLVPTSTTYHLVRGESREIQQ